MKKLNLDTSANRFRKMPTCFCDKSNKDGKCVPDKYIPNAGYCHGCDKTFFGDEEKEYKTEYIPEPEKEPTFHPTIQKEGSLKRYDENNLTIFLKKLFPEINIEEKAKDCGIGTSNHYDGNSTIFWQTDINGNIRGGKIIKYNPSTGKRLKEVMPPVSWVHSILKIPFTLKQCLFGSHLLSDEAKSVGVVESEKTAFIMSLIDSSRIWVATGSKGNFKYDLLKCLKGRKVIAYPDNGEYNLWSERALAVSIYGINITVSKMLENPSNAIGWDLADELIEALINQPPPLAIKKKYQDFSRKERILFGMEKFKKEDLQILAEDIFRNCRKIHYQPITDILQTTERITPTDAEDLLDILCLQKVLTVTDRGYILNN